jgi:GxxExxY protein
VEDLIIIELKATEGMPPVFLAQLITYLKLSNKKLGYLINFNVPLLKDGFKRVVNISKTLAAPPFSAVKK